MPPERVQLQEEHGGNGTSSFSEPHSLAKSAGIFPQDKSQHKVSRQAAVVMICWK